MLFFLDLVNDWRLYGIIGSKNKIVKRKFFFFSDKRVDEEENSVPLVRTSVRPGPDKQ